MKLISAIIQLLLLIGAMSLIANAKGFHGIRHHYPPRIFHFHRIRISVKSSRMHRAKLRKVKMAKFKHTKGGKARQSKFTPYECKDTQFGVVC